MENREAYKFTSDDAENYDFYLGPVMFEPYGRYLASRIDTENLSRMLELACGTGRVTKYIREALPDKVELFATDLSGDMLDIARRKLGGADIHFKTEDIQSLSFTDNSFDLAICQFGMMFLSDKQKGFNEMLRVLRPGGRLMCFTWNAVPANPLFDIIINDFVLPYFPGEDNTRFYTPFSLHDSQQLAAWMQNAGFTEIHTETINLASGPSSPEHIGMGSFFKHPLGKAVKDKDPSAFAAIGEKLKKEIEHRYGPTAVFPMSALLTVGTK